MFNIENTENIISPSLVFFEKQIDANIQRAIEQSGDPKRLWPHVKTHKTKEIVNKLLACGVNKFKCATIAECEMVASCGAGSILLSYPMVGPNLDRFIKIAAAFPQIKWYALFDDLNELKTMNEKAAANKAIINVFIDVNVGLNRTGVLLDKVTDFVKGAIDFKSIVICGLHCYDGQNGISDFAARHEAISKLVIKEKALRDEVASVLDHDVMVIAGGTPEFPCYKELSDFYCSPGTLFLQDHGYQTLFTDMKYEPAAAVLTRCISHPCDGYFTLDCGYKGIAADPKGIRGVIVGLEDKVEDLFQNEEHWVFKMKPGYEKDRPNVGDVLYVIPTHICPTSALYPQALVVNDGKVTATWEIFARNRKISF